MVTRLKRVYEPPTEDDGYRVLVERLWPRGVTKEKAHVDLWLKEAGASTELRKWFAHDPEKWEDFIRRYYNELRHRTETLNELNAIIRDHATVTFLYSAHDEVHNNAVALKGFLDQISITPSAII